MTNKTKDAAGLLWAAAITGLWGLAVYLYTSCTGYLASSSVSLAPALCAGAGAAALAAAALGRAKLPAVAVDLLTMAGTVLLIAGFAFFALLRVSLAADVYFIPVNYPAAEETALHISIVGLVLELVGIVCGIAAAFSKDL